MAYNFPQDYTEKTTLNWNDLVILADSEDLDANGNPSVNKKVKVSSISSGVLAAWSTSDLEEGSNLYFTEERVDDKALKDNVLELDNVDEYTPTEDYHPATKKFVSDSMNEWLSALLSTRVAWEVISTWDAIAHWNFVIAQPLDSLVYTLLLSSANYEAAQEFSPSVDIGIESITLTMYRFWSPVWVCNVEIYSDTWSTLIWTSSNTVNISTLTTSTAWEDRIFNFSWISLTAGATYYFKINLTSGTISWSNFFRVKATNSFAWTELAYLISQAWVWTAQSGWSALKYTIKDSNYTYIKADSAYNLNFIWFAKTGAAYWSNFALSLSWIATGFTSLIPNQSYYLSSTKGGISSTWSVKVWKSLSETELLINTWAF